MDIFFMKQADPNYKPDRIVREGFGLVRGKKGEYGMFNVSVPTLAFLLEGNITLDYNQHVKDYLANGNGFMCVFPMAKFHRVKMNEDTVCVFLFIIGDNLSFCRRILTDESLRNMPKSTNILPVLRIVPQIRAFADQMMNYIDKREHLTRDISPTMQSGLQDLLMANYTQNELQRLLLPLYYTDESFYFKVSKLAEEFLSIEEMAARLNMSRSAFLRRFKRTFKQTPKQWSSEIKKNILYRALRETNLPLEQISQRLHFSSLQHMNIFCRKSLNKTPMSIRKGSSKYISL